MRLTDTERNELLVELDTWREQWDSLVPDMTGECAAAYAASVAYVEQARTLALEATAGEDGTFDVPGLEAALDGFEGVVHGLDDCNTRTGLGGLFLLGGALLGVAGIIYLVGRKRGF